MRAHIDEPAPSSQVTPHSFIVRGWIWLGAQQADLAAVEVWSGEVLLGETPGMQARPDVRSALGLPPDALPGFMVVVAHPAARSAPSFPLEIRARFRDGTRSSAAAGMSVAPQVNPTDPLSVLLAQVRPDARGLEIGAHALPVPGVTPFYTDAVANYAGCDGRADFLADARALPLPDATLDYLCSSHVLEHLPDPLAALREWHRVLRPGGWLYLVVPDRRYTFDEPRPTTPPEHIVNDYVVGTTAADLADHVDEFIFQADWSRLSPDCPPEERPIRQAATRARYLDDLARGIPIDIHFHTFTPESLLAVLRQGGLIGNAQPLFELVCQAERFPPERADGIGLLLRKCGTSNEAPASESYAIAHRDRAIPPLPLVCPNTLEPLHLVNTADRGPALISSRSERRYPLENGRPRLLPVDAAPLIRSWNLASAHRLNPVTTATGAAS